MDPKGWTNFGESNNRQSAVNILTGALELPGNDPVPNGVVGSNGFSRGLYNTVYGAPDFQPRFGFAWSPALWNGKTVIRGAFTISSYLEGTGVNLRDTQNPPYAAPQTETNNVETGPTAFTTATAFASASGVNPYVGATLQTWSGTVQPAVADQWNVTVQQELAHDTTFQLSYIGQRTTHLMVPEWLSQGDLQPNGTVTYPFIGGQNPAGTVIDGITTTTATYGPNGFGNVKNTASVGNMNYNAMQVVLQKRYSHGLEGQVSYTFEKCMTNDDGYYGTWGTTTQAGPSGKVDKAVFFSALITVAGFVPLFTMEGVEGQIFGPMARTYGYALAGALISTFTVTPVLASFFLPDHVAETETIVVRLLHRIYNPTLRFALAHRVLVVMAGLVFLGATAVLSLRLGSEFLPHLEEGNFWIRASMPMTLSLQDGEEAARKMRLILRRHPEVLTVVSQHGRPDNGSDASPFSNVELFVPLKPFDQWPKGLSKEKLTEQIQGEFDRELPGINFNFSQYIQDNIEEAISGVKGANSIKIIGPNLQMLETLAAKVRDEMSHVPGVADLGIFPLLGQPNLNIKVDRAKAARYGLNTGDVTTVIQAAMGGAAATTVLEGDRQFGVVVRFAPEFRDTAEKIGNIKVACTSSSGVNAYIPLSELATISLDTGAAWIYHESTKRYIPVKFSVRGRDLGSTVAEAQARIAKNVKLPSGYRLVWSGEFEDLQNAKQRLELIVPLSLGLIICLLYTLYNSVLECV